MGSLRTLLLTGRDVEELLSDMRPVMEVVEKAFRDKGMGKVEMPPKVYVDFTEHGGDLRAMPAYIPSIGAAAVKVVNSHPGNKDYGLPTVMAVIVLIDPKTGFPLAIMDGTYITRMRTGAVGGIAAKYLAIDNPRTVAMIGAGAQARAQLQALATVYESIEEVRVYDLTPRNREAYIAEMSKKLGGINFVDSESAERAVRGADIVTTTTPSRMPIIKDSWVSNGMHFNCIGADAPGKQELDPAILKRSKIVVDDIEQAVHGGEINVPIRTGQLKEEDIYAELGEIVAGIKPGRVSRDEITVFTSTGLAIQDLATAKLVYDEAVKRGIGRRIELISGVRSCISEG